MRIIGSSSPTVPGSTGERYLQEYTETVENTPSPVKVLQILCHALLSPEVISSIARIPTDISGVLMFYERTSCRATTFTWVHP